MTGKEKRLAGTLVYRSDPRRKRPVKMSVIIAACKRGWTSTKIAAAAGVSHQAVTCRIKRYEERHGKIEYMVNCNGATGPRYPWRCNHCNALHWSTESRIDRTELKFCSIKCSAAYYRTITDEMVESAIAMRRNKNSWKNIGKAFKRPAQGIQLRIWKHLAMSGQLTMSAVHEIWQNNDRYASWKWIERNTGIYCTEHGIEFTKPTYDQNKKTAWGRVVWRSCDDSASS